MEVNNRSIGQNLKRAKSIESKKVTAKEWSKGVSADLSVVIRDLEVFKKKANMNTVLLKDYEKILVKIKLLAKRKVGRFDSVIEGLLESEQTNKES